MICILVPFVFLTDINADGSSGVGGTAGLCGDGQADFRSILSYGVQEPWVKPSFTFMFPLGSPINNLLLVLRRKFSDSITEMLVVCATTVHRVGLKTAPNELCPHVPLMAWNTCAFTIQAIGNDLAFLLIRSGVQLMKHICFSSQKTYCRKKISHCLDPYRTDRLDTTYLKAQTIKNNACQFWG